MTRPTTPQEAAQAIQAALQKLTGKVYAVGLEAVGDRPAQAWIRGDEIAAVQLVLGTLGLDFEKADRLSPRGRAFVILEVPSPYVAAAALEELVAAGDDLAEGLREDGFGADAGPPPPVSRQCSRCLHYQGIGELDGPEDLEAPVVHVCKAFPKGIPEVVLEETFDHRQPFDGDRGTTFELAEGVAMDDVDAIFEVER